MKFPLLLPGRGRMGSGSCKGTRRSARASCLPQSSSWQGQNPPKSLQALRKETHNPPFPPRPQEAKQRQDSGTENPNTRRKISRNSNPGASHTGSLQHPPRFHLFISKTPRPQPENSPRTRGHRCRHVGFNVTPPGSASLPRIPVGWSETLSC